MGMYDHVKFKMNCPRCNKKMNDFQTKDGSQSLSVLNWWDVSNFYTHCNYCRTWVEFILVDRPNRKLTIKDYKKIVKLTTKKDDEEYKKRMDIFFGGVKK